MATVWKVNGAMRRRWHWGKVNWLGIVRWLLPALGIILRQAAAAYGLLSTRILPAPLQVLEAAERLVANGELLQHLQVSLGRAGAGILIGGGVGFVLGVLGGVSRVCEALWDSSLQMIRNVPHLALIPLVILWFGIGETSKVFLVALGVFFPVYINTFYGIRNVDAGLLEMARAYHAGRLTLFTQVLLPGALPTVLVGVRQALGVAWVSLVVAETIAADAGIGYLTMDAREFVQTDVIVLGILLYALIGKLADSLTRLLERWWLQWHPSYSSKAA